MFRERKEKKKPDAIHNVEEALLRDLWAFVSAVLVNEPAQLVAPRLSGRLLRCLGQHASIRTAACVVCEKKNRRMRHTLRAYNCDVLELERGRGKR